jgi:hypothetical protein
MKPAISAFLALNFALAAARTADAPPAPVPRVISYQGLLTDGSGRPLEGSYSITFKLFDGATEIWMENHTSVSLHNGVFQVMLGVCEPLPGLASARCSVEVKVAGETISPRFALASVPYALIALDATTLNGLPTDSFLLSRNGAVRMQHINRSSAEQGDVLTWHFDRWTPRPPDRALFGGGLPGYTARWTDPRTLGTSSIRDNGLSVAVGAEPDDAWRILGRRTPSDFGALGGTGYGVYGSGTYYGCYGIGFEAGVYGKAGSAAGYGVYGVSGDCGVCGYSNTSHALGMLATDLPVDAGLYGTGPGQGGFGAWVSGRYAGAYGECLSGAHGMLGATDPVVAGVYAFSEPPRSFGLYAYTLDSTSCAVSGACRDDSTRGELAGPQAGAYGFAYLEGDYGVCAVHGFSTGSGAYSRSTAIWGRNHARYSPAAAFSNQNPVEPVYSNLAYRYVAHNYGLRTNGLVVTVIETEDHGARTLYAAAQAEPWHEDFGTASLDGIRCRVELDPVFLQTVTIDHDHPLMVFLTQTSGEHVLVRVDKRETGFDIVAQHESNASFDYRVIARRRGAEDARLEDATAEHLAAMRSGG